MQNIILLVTPNFNSKGIESRTKSVSRLQNECHKHYKPGLFSNNETDSTLVSALVPVQVFYSKNKTVVKFILYTNTEMFMKTKNSICER